MPEKRSQCNPIDLLVKALEHPAGQELVSMVYHMHQNTQAKDHPDPRRVARAISLAKAKSLEKSEIPYFKGMTNDQIDDWIAQYS